MYSTTGFVVVANSQRKDLDPLIRQKQVAKTLFFAPALH